MVDFRWRTHKPPITNRSGLFDIDRVVNGTLIIQEYSTVVVLECGVWRVKNNAMGVEILKN